MDYDTQPLHYAGTVRCEECGFVWEDWSTYVLPGELRHIGQMWREALTAASPHPRLRTRPEAGVRSPLEYACHPRDVLLTQR